MLLDVRMLAVSLAFLALVRLDRMPLGTNDTIDHYLLQVEVL